MKRFGLIGKSLSHSFSPSFFNTFFQEKEINATYETFELSEIKEVKKVFDLQPEGLNVTIPYKESIVSFLDEILGVANEIQAVNTIKFENGKTYGLNTDAHGFHQSIKPFLTNKHEKALILGTGGAAKAVVQVLKNLGIEVLFATRNPENKPKHFGYSEINEHFLKACKLIVNTTPLGMYPNVNEEHTFPLVGISDEHLVVDLIYNPVKTLLLQKSEKLGATILNGESMLREQALMSWDVWNKPISQIS